MKAPKPSIERCAYASSTPSEPPPSPVIARKVRVPKNHWCSSRPRLPSGFSRLCSGPAPKPSSEIEKPATRTFVIRHSLPCQPSHDSTIRRHCRGSDHWKTKPFDMLESSYQKRQGTFQFLAKRPQGPARLLRDLRLDSF